MFPLSTASYDGPESMKALTALFWRDLSLCLGMGAAFATLLYAASGFSRASLCFLGFSATSFATGGILHLIGPKRR